MAKKKDFAKQKLKVGKLGTKPSSATNTSVKAKALRLRPQSLGSDAGTSTAAQISLTQHHAGSARRGAVLALSGQIASGVRASDIAAIVAAIAALTTDSDRQVRLATTQFFKALPPQILAAHVPLVVLHVCAAMTHITPAIRADATQLLDVIVQAAPETTLRVGFARALRLFFPLLGWPEPPAGGADSSAKKHGDGGSASGTVVSALSFGANAAKTQLGHLKSLHTLISVGIAEQRPDTENQYLHRRDTHLFLLPRVPSALAPLYKEMAAMTAPVTSLYHGLSNNNGRTGKSGQPEITEDAAARRLLLAELRPALLAGLKTAARDGGEAGRVAGKVSQLLVSF